jgi:hypothetical protein
LVDNCTQRCNTQLSILEPPQGITKACYAQYDFPLTINHSPNHRANQQIKHALDELKHIFDIIFEKNIVLVEENLFIINIHFYTVSNERNY